MAASEGASTPLVSPYLAQVSPVPAYSTLISSLQNAKKDGGKIASALESLCFYEVPPSIVEHILHTWSPDNRKVIRLSQVLLRRTTPEASCNLSLVIMILGKEMSASSAIRRICGMRIFSQFASCSPVLIDPKLRTTFGEILVKEDDKKSVAFKGQELGLLQSTVLSICLERKLLQDDLMLQIINCFMSTVAVTVRYAMLLLENAIQTNPRFFRHDVISALAGMMPLKVSNNPVTLKKGKVVEGQAPNLDDTLARVRLTRLCGLLISVKSDPEDVFYKQLLNSLVDRSEQVFFSASLELARLSWARLMKTEIEPLPQGESNPYFAHIYHILPCKFSSLSVIIDRLAYALGRPDGSKQSIPLCFQACRTARLLQQSYEEEHVHQSSQPSRHPLQPIASALEQLLLSELNGHLRLEALKAYVWANGSENNLVLITTEELKRNPAFTFDAVLVHIKDRIFINHRFLGVALRLTQLWFTHAPDKVDTRLISEVWDSIISIIPSIPRTDTDMHTQSIVSILAHANKDSSVVLDPFYLTVLMVENIFCMLQLPETSGPIEARLNLQRFALDYVGSSAFNKFIFSLNFKDPGIQGCLTSRRSTKCKFENDATARGARGRRQSGLRGQSNTPPAAGMPPSLISSNPGGLPIAGQKGSKDTNTMSRKPNIIAAASTSSLSRFVKKSEEGSLKDDHHKSSSSTALSSLPTKALKLKLSAIPGDPRTSVPAFTSLGEAIIRIILLQIEAFATFADWQTRNVCATTLTSLAIHAPPSISYHIHGFMKHLIQDLSWECCESAEILRFLIRHHIKVLRESDKEGKEDADGARHLRPPVGSTSSAPDSADEERSPLVKRMTIVSVSLFPETESYIDSIKAPSLSGLETLFLPNAVAAKTPRTPRSPRVERVERSSHDDGKASSPSTSSKLRQKSNTMKIR
mmetsp:Transcript_37412/g.93980  ORF Transcript_37412/g.93980 Transcript_37412/m.93980 type:complete len:925 (-) Transcript_37412:213-2987(-)